MKRLSLAPIFLLAAVASAQTPAIERITPSLVTTGMLITIEGHGFGSEASVQIGNEAPSTRDVSDTRLTAIVLDPALGATDVTVTTESGVRIVAPKALFMFRSIEPNYTRRILPIYLEDVVYGARGSEWVTDFALRNADGDELGIAPWQPACGASGLCSVTPSVFSTVKARTTLRELPKHHRQSTGNPGRMIYLGPGERENFSMSLRVRDRSRDRDSAGTALPILGWQDLSFDAIEIVDVPVDRRFRLMLRVYDGEVGPTRFRVSLFRSDSDDDVIARFELTATSPQNGEFRDLPTYAEKDLTPLLASETGPIRVFIHPLTYYSHFWAFVSITNDETQQVTIATPR